MTTALLTKEQVDNLTYKECKAALKLLNKTYRMDTPIAELSKEEWALCDDIGNTLLWLEDRIYRFEDSRVPSMDPTATTVEKPEPKEVVSKRPPRRCMVNGVEYDSVSIAAKKTGIKLGTLRTYIRRKPDIYKYID